MTAVLKHVLRTVGTAGNDSFDGRGARLHAAVEKLQTEVRVDIVRWARLVMLLQLQHIIAIATFNVSCTLFPPIRTIWCRTCSTRRVSFVDGFADSQIDGTMCDIAW